MNEQTIFFKNPVFVMDTATIVGPMETDGPIGKYFDKHVDDDILGQKSHELAESAFHIYTIKFLMNKAKINAEEIDLCVSGDLTDEIYGTNFAMRDLKIPFLGMYNACATFGSALITASTYVDGGYARRVICSTSSHFASAERQYRFPLEYGGQRTPLSQWTVTGCGATLLNNKFGKVRIDCATIGKVVDYGVTDANDMGAAMAPSARDTLVKHFRGTGRRADYYDLVLTGDLGEGGSRILKALMKEEGYPLGDNYSDCGILIYNRMAQKVEQGGSGAGCSSVVFNGFVYKKMMSGELKRVLLVPTGALISKTSTLQGQPIPGIAHAISFTTEG
ncbi:MAG: stage V sporulation protein AD [Firmicutes bacterium]|nr:stage V sporulation protein AD [Bacillota bacterium]